jgi:hypothetical protein
MASPFQLTGFNETEVRLVTATSCDMHDKSSILDRVPYPNGFWGPAIGMETPLPTVVGLGREADNTAPSNTDVKNVWSPRN